MQKTLHPKILALRNSVGSSPWQKAIPFEHTEATRAAATSDGRTLKQYFAIWGVKDDYGTMPIKGCFSKSIKERGPKSNSSYKITALYAHCLRDSVGLPSVLKEDDIGLYGEVPVLDGIQVCDELVIRHVAGVCNNGSYGFNYIWDKMEYDEDAEAILMKECELLEISFVTIGSQKETHGVRSSSGIITDETLIGDTEKMIKRLPKESQLEIRSIIDRHISLAKSQPAKPLQKRKPKNEVIDYNFLLKNI